MKPFEDLVNTINPDWKSDPDMRDTPLRIKKMFEHFTRKDDPKKHLEKIFPTKNDQAVIVKDIECFGMCPHHLVPIIYRVHIGYIPDGWALGLSKLARIAIDLASYPKLQENYTNEIAELLEGNLKPLGVMVVVDGVHGCMRCRGVEQSFSSTITSDCRGVFMTEPEARAEFLSLIK